MIAALQVSKEIFYHPLHFSTEGTPLLVCGTALVVSSLAYLVRDTREHEPGKEYGSGRWGTKKEMKKFRNKKKFSDNIILGRRLL